jgi:hypothetical protein
MSLAGIERLSETDRNTLPLLFNALTVVKDVVYKTLYAIACCNFKRAWEKLGISSDDKRIPGWSEEYHDAAITIKSPAQTLAHWQLEAIHILYLTTYFAKKDNAQLARKFLIDTFKLTDAVHRFSHTVNISDAAIHLMEIMEDGFADLAHEIKNQLPSYHNLALCLEAYSHNPSSLECEENAILACRGIRHMTEGAALIAELKSPLALNSNLHQPTNVVKMMRAKL